MLKQNSDAFTNTKIGIYLNVRIEIRFLTKALGRFLLCTTSLELIAGLFQAFNLSLGLVRLPRIHSQIRERCKLFINQLCRDLRK